MTDTTDTAADWLQAAADPPTHTDVETHAAIVDGGLHLGRSETAWVRADAATTIHLGDAR